MKCTIQAEIDGLLRLANGVPKCLGKDKKGNARLFSNHQYRGQDLCKQCGYRKYSANKKPAKAVYREIMLRVNRLKEILKTA